jgi:hypothetical protein
MRHSRFPRFARGAIVVCAAAAFGACGGDSTSPVASPDALLLTGSVLKSLDSSAQAVEQANAGNIDLKAFVDSSLLALSTGITAKRLAVSTDLTTLPLYFVGIHRALNQSSGGGYSTWTLVGFDDPKHLTTLIEVSGYASAAAGGPPASVSGALGPIIDARFFAARSDGSITEWIATTGSASFLSDAPTGGCPDFTPTSTITCAIEAMHIHFSASAPSGSGAPARQAGVTTDVPVSAMRLTYSP